MPISLPNFGRNLKRSAELWRVGVWMRLPSSWNVTPCFLWHPGPTCCWSALSVVPVMQSGKRVWQIDWGQSICPQSFFDTVSISWLLAMAKRWIHWMRQKKVFTVCAQFWSAEVLWGFMVLLIWSTFFLAHDLRVARISMSALKQTFSQKTNQ